jgi:predicted anti-sigma-YlaC factor YlaD
MNAEPLPASCARVRERLDLALDGGLAPLEAARDAGHLEACASCAALARTRAQWLADVRAALAPAAAQQRAADARALAALRGEARPALTPARRPAVAALLAAAALALLAAWPALPGGSLLLRTWADGASAAGRSAESFPPLSWNPQAFAPRVGR